MTSKKRRSILVEKSAAHQQNIVRSPKSEMCRFLSADVVQRNINFDRFRALRSIEASVWIELTSKKRRLISVEKAAARQQRLLGPRKSRCVDFIWLNIEQTLFKFRSFSGNSIDRGVNHSQTGLDWLGWARCEIPTLYGNRTQESPNGVTIFSVVIPIRGDE